MRILFKMVAFQILKNNKREINPRVLRKMQYICKKDKINQAERIWESIIIIELKELKHKYNEMEKEKKDADMKYASIKEVY